MTKRNRLSLDQHRDIGEALSAMAADLVSLQLHIAGPVYPLQGRITRQIERSHASINRLRSTLEGRLFEEHPDAATKTIYYPRRSPEKGSWQ